MPANFSKALLEWYAAHARELPWRGIRDAYGVWISEIMLQQTRVETVIPYYQRWMERFPDMASLANANPQDVLAAWEGLGYYSRARNLQHAAQIVVSEYGGKLPQQARNLRKLPGIGRYSAGAIASIAFGQDEPALDGNIRRVLARLFNISEPERSPSGERQLWELAKNNLPAGQAGEYNQALMDLGSMVCLPRAPNCSACPLQPFCQAYALGIQEQRPVSTPRPQIPHYTVTAAIIQNAGQVLIAQRPNRGLLGGLWEFPGGKLQPGEDLASCLQREIIEELGVQVQVGERSGIYRHAYTHFRITLHAFFCTLADKAQPRPLEHSALEWVAPQALVEYPMGKIDRLIATRLMENT